MDNDIIYTATSKVSDELPLTMVGDKVSIEFIKSDAEIISMSEFNNLNLGTEKEDNTTSENQKDEDKMSTNNEDEKNQ